jgi:Transposase IS116/IS110/IS902 family
VAAVSPLLEARMAIEQQIDDLDRKVLKLARHDAQVRRFMTTPGIGPITALCFKATIDDPTRFRRSRSVGAYVGLTSRRLASGEVDWSGRISKCGDAMLRMYLFEAAGVLLTRVPKWSVLKAWGTRLAKRNGLRKAKVAVARKLAVILHRMWIDGIEFNWSTKKAVASLPGRWQWRDRPILCVRSKERPRFHIDPPTSSYAIMRRACPYRGRTVGQARTVMESLTLGPGIRELTGSSTR